MNEYVKQENMYCMVHFQCNEKRISLQKKIQAFTPQMHTTRPLHERTQLYRSPKQKAPHRYNASNLNFFACNPERRDHCSRFYVFPPPLR